MIGFEDITVENYVSVRNADQMKGHQVNLYEESSSMVKQTRVKWSGQILC